MGYFEYKGMFTTARWDKSDKVYYGRFNNEGDVVDFISPTLNGFVFEFHRAVDEYFQYCHDIGKQPTIKAYAILD